MSTFEQRLASTKAGLTPHYAARDDEWFAWYPVRLGALGTGRFAFLETVWRDRCMGVAIYQDLAWVRENQRQREQMKAEEAAREEDRRVNDDLYTQRLQELFDLSFERLGQDRALEWLSEPHPYLPPISHYGVGSTPMMSVYTNASFEQSKAMLAEMPIVYATTGFPHVQE